MRIGMTFGVLALLSVSSVVTAAQFQAGASTSNITPPIGTDIIGGFVPYPSRHIHDELQARCLVLDDGQVRLAIVVCDLLGIHRAVSDEARRLVAETSGIPRENVLISATHTHSATSALGQDRLQPDQVLDDYQRFVSRRIADGIARAMNNRRPAQLAFGTVDIPDHVFNRRWRMQPGTVPANPFGGVDLVKMNPPPGSPNLIEPAGPIDPGVSIISVKSMEGHPISVLATYSLHYVGGVGATDISSDYYGACCSQLEKLINESSKPPREHPPFVAILANGTSGDINNINFTNPRPAKKPYEQIQFVSDDVASRVFNVVSSLKYKDQVALSAIYREPLIGWRQVTDDQKKWADQTLAGGQKSPQDLSYIYAQRTKRLSEYTSKETTLPVQILRIGDICIGTMPCEVFCEIGLDFKSRSPIQPSFMIELAHGYYGYLPTPRHIQLGGYETWIGTNRLEATASEKLLSNLLQMAGELAGTAKPVRLFDGQSFAGWDGDTEKTWRIEEGAFVAGSLEETVPRNEFLATRREYSNFDLRLKYKLVGTEGFVNGGVQFRTKRIPNHHEVIGYQADLGAGFDGHIYDESRRKKMLAVPDKDILARALKKDDWNEYRIRAEGPRIQLWLNGVQTVDYVEQEPEIESRGIIAVQIHGGCKAIVRYKEIEIIELSDSKTP